MRVWTYGEALDIVKSEFDLTNESFIGDDEMVGFFNRGIQNAAADIYKMGLEDDYFADDAPLSLVQGQALVNLPPKIYAQKIRAIEYANGTEIYEILKMRRKKKFFKEAEIETYAPDARYQYRITNSGTATGVQIKLVPPSRITSNTIVTCYYHREAEFIPLVSAGSLAASRATKIDLPPCMDYILAFVMWKVAKKIPHPDLQSYKDDRDEARMLMKETLTGQTDDDSNEVEPDLTHYQEHS